MLAGSALKAFKITGNFVVKYPPNQVTLERKISRGLHGDGGAYLVMFMHFISSDCLYKNICCWNSFELSRYVEAIQMSTHNICLIKK